MQPMKIECAMIANGGGVENGLLNVVGGGWEHFRTEMFPAPVAGVVAGIAVLERDEIGQLLPLRFVVRDQDGHVAGAAGSTVISGVRPETVPGVPTRVPFAFMFTTAVAAPTVVRVALFAAEPAGGAAQDDPAPLCELTFAVLDPVPDPSEFG